MKKKSQNELSVVFPSLSVNEGVARSLAGIFLSQLNPTVDELADVKCAVSEAVTNAIVHGYRGTVGDIHLTMSVLPERTVRIEVKDRGVGIPDIEAAMEPLFTTDAAGERSGMGFPIMESFMDILTVKSAPDKGCKVTMMKKLSTIRRTREMTVIG